MKARLSSPQAYLVPYRLTILPIPQTEPSVATPDVRWPGADADSVVAMILRRWLDYCAARPLRVNHWHRAADRWIAILVDEIGRIFSCDVQLLAQVGSRWELLARHGGLAGAGIWDEALISTALDSPEPIVGNRFVAVAIHRGGEPVELDNMPTGSRRLTPTVLMLQLPAAKKLDTSSLHTITAMAVTLQTLDRQQFQLGNSGDSAAHLRRLLDLSIRWSQIEKPDELLEAIATSSAELLGAQRASIFLWEKRRGKLIGRPALGVEGGKLEVDDNAGVVGTVLASGAPRIWHADEDSEAEVNRAVDRKLKFHTRSLVAVPLRAPTGAVIGVFEVLNKIQGRFDPGDAAQLADLARHAAIAIQGTETRQRLMSSRDRLLHDAASSIQVIGNCPAVSTLRDTVARVARTDLAVLALGENGTGKEVLARSIHFQSSRRDQPFVAVNCAALVESLLESELFGHERGAFTDAIGIRVGKFELASGGTLFLDEIGDMSPGGQAKLLRVLEEKIVVRVGGSTPIPVDVRIIAATNQSLPDLVTEKRFREDLFFRLNVVSFRLPPLRERGDDILLLANHFLAQFSSQIGRTQPTFSAEARQSMLRHRWPGNIRELRNVMERVCYLTSSDMLSESDLGLPDDDHRAVAGAGTGRLTTHHAAFANSIDTDGTASLGDATRDFQIAHIQAAINTQQNNMTAAAETLGLHRSNLYRKMRQLGMQVDDSHGGGD